MVGVLQIVLVILGVGLIMALTGGRSGTDRKKDMIARRVEAYIETIRRTGEPDHLNKMSDAELSDILTAAARRLHAQRTNRMIVTIAAAVAAVVIAMFFGAESGIQGFIIAGVIGAAATYGINAVLERRTGEWFRDNDLEPDRLAVD